MGSAFNERHLACNRRDFMRGVAASGAAACLHAHCARADLFDPDSPLAMGANTCLEVHPFNPAEVAASLDFARSPVASFSSRMEALRAKLEFEAIEKRAARNAPAFPGAPAAPAASADPRPQFYQSMGSAGARPEDLSDYRPPRLALERAKLWNPDRSVTWSYVTDGPAWLTKIIDEAFEEWQSHIKLKLIKRPSGSTEIKVGFAEKGFFSLVGTDSAVNGLRARYRGASLNIQPNAPSQDYRVVALHEIGHALGAIHEHQSPNANIPWDFASLRREYGRGSVNDWSDEEIRYQIVNRYSAAVSNASEFDLQSIMLYPIKAEHLLQSDPNRMSFVKGWNTKLSNLDIAFMQKHYGVPDQSTAVKGGDDAGAADNLTRRAITLDLDAKQSGEIARDGDYQYYRITVKTAGTYVVETVDRNPATFVELQFFDTLNANSPKATNSLGGARLLNARLELSLEPGEFFVRVKHRHYYGRGKYIVYFHAK